MGLGFAAFLIIPASAYADLVFKYPQYVLTENFPTDVKIADLNGDGYKDLVTANTVDDSVSVALGSNQGFTEPAENYPVGDAPEGLVVGDLNRDENLDLVTA
ncbi:MAG TPA: VCBS repeat-containing protein, partial [Solirubrobacterales bacterium]|nr:VCBS repeat-containing protein [Solirubrobacterales bacterium]